MAANPHEARWASFPAQFLSAGARATPAHLLYILQSIRLRGQLVASLTVLHPHTWPYTRLQI